MYITSPKVSLQRAYVIGFQEIKPREEVFVLYICPVYIYITNRTSPSQKFCILPVTIIVSEVCDRISSEIQILYWSVSKSFQTVQRFNQIVTEVQPRDMWNAWDMSE